MKKILLTLSFVCSILILTAQNVVSISGTVSGSTGGLIPNYPVQIMSDSTMGFVYLGTATTNANGAYTHSISIPSFFTQGAFYVIVQDSCSGAFLSQTVFFSPATTSFTNVNFTMCQASSSCAASFTHSVTSTGAVSFTSSATGGQAPYTYNWSFGDGTNSTSANPTHTYNVPGSVFQVCLTITDAAGCSATYCNSVIVNAGSSCQAGYTSSTQGNTVTFTNTSTGGNPFFPLIYTWDFGDNNFGFSQNPTHTYATAGTYLACLTAFDSLGCYSVYCDTIVIGGSSGSCQVSFTHTSNITTVAFSSSVSGGQAPYTYAWSFGDGTTSNAANPNHPYNSTGTYQVCLTITDANGCSATYCDLVILSQGSGGCQAAFTSSTQGTTTTFTNNSTGGATGLLYTWDFGDGSFGYTQNPTHTYPNAGTYLVCLTAFDSLGCFSTYCDTVIAGGGGSTCAAVFSHFTTPGTGITYFTGGATGGTAPYSYFWDFGDGTTANGQNPAHLYNNVGTYNVCLTITDTLGCTDTYCDSLFAFGGGNNCSVSFTYQTNPFLGTISFMSSTIGAAPFTYAWNFGDGNTSTQGNPNHTYANPGTYTVTLTVIDANGCTSIFTGLVLAGGSGQPCTVSYNYMIAATGSTVSFSAIGTGGVAPYSYFWDFGDGNSATGQGPTHTYAANGIYGACVTMFDSSGCVATYCDTIVIGNSGSFGYLSGIVIADSLFPAQAEVQLIAYDSTTSTFTLTAIDTTMQGTFNFVNIPSGDYLLRAKLLPSDPNYANYLPTYYTQTLYWNNATSVNVNPAIFQFIVLPLIQGSNSGNTAVGQNFIGGTVTLSIWRGGGPAPDVPVFIMEQDMTPFGYTFTDANGDYSFSQLPDGVYYIYVEHTGLLTTPIQVTVNNGTPTIDNVDFEIDDYYVAFTDTEQLNSIEQLNVFPNPVLSQLNVQLTLTQNMEVSVSVMSVTGQLLQQTQYEMASGQNDVVIPTTELPSGVYMLRLETNEGVVTEKFVKQ